jgi:Ase1/PRC1/MAP65 family protein
MTYFGCVQCTASLKFHTLLQLQDLGSTLIELWNLMDTPTDEQRFFDHVTSLIKVSPTTAMPQGCLAHEIIEKVIILPSPLTLNLVDINT